MENCPVIYQEPFNLFIPNPSDWKLNVNCFYEKITKPTNFTMQECKAKEFLLGIAEHLSETDPKKFGMLLEFTLQGIIYLNMLIVSHCCNYYICKNCNNRSS